MLKPFIPRYGYSRSEVGLSCLTSGSKGLCYSPGYQPVPPTGCVMYCHVCDNAYERSLAK